MSMWFVSWGTYVLSGSNIDLTLSMYMVLRYSTKTPTFNKSTNINSILQHTSVITENSASVTDNLTVFWLCECHAMPTPLIIIIHPVMILWMLLSSA